MIVCFSALLSGLGGSDSRAVGELFTNDLTALKLGCYTNLRRKRKKNPIVGSIESIFS